MNKRMNTKVEHKKTKPKNMCPHIRQMFNYPQEWLLSYIPATDEFQAAVRADWVRYSQLLYKSLF